MRFRRTPLAWRSITHDKKRFVLSVGGIMFATVLMFTQLGFLNAVFDSQTELIHRLNADLVIVSTARHRLGLGEPFARRRIEQARGVEGVLAVYPLYVEHLRGSWKNPQTRRPYALRVIGLNPDEPVLLGTSLEELAPRLRVEDNALIDIRSKETFGPRHVGLKTELDGHQVRIAGNFELGTDFDFDGTVILGEHTFLKIFSAARAGPRMSRVDLGLVRLRAGVDLDLARQRLAEVLPDDVQVVSPRELAAREIVFWRSATPIGIIFGVGLVIGFIVGIVICSQILYTSVVDRMPLFGTLKAIGYTNGYLVRLVVGEAVWLAVLAFIPGLLAAWALYRFLSGLVGFAMFLTAARILLILSMTAGMSMIAACVALRKALAADPAEVFK